MCARQARHSVYGCICASVCVCDFPEPGERGGVGEGKGGAWEVRKGQTWWLCLRGQVGTLRPSGVAGAYGPNANWVMGLSQARHARGPAECAALRPYVRIYISYMCLPACLS